MNFVAIGLNHWGTYSYRDASSIEMSHLGSFFVDDVGYAGSVFKKWVIESADGDRMSGNSTVLQREIDDILLWDEYLVTPTPVKLRMTVQQFLQIFDEWAEKVVKRRPKGVVIKHDEGFFWIEIFNE